MERTKRILGFDLTRAYAIFGMYVVNFNMVFGNPQDTSWAAKFLSSFSGNSSTVFVMLAGMGISFMTNRHLDTHEQKKIRNTVIKRACFLFVLGLLLCLWWPADILHFYGVYMLIASAILFINKKYYVSMAMLVILIFHLLLIVLPFDTGWNFETFEYRNFWSLKGFVINTFYNGWNSVFPWLAYFTVGMYLGKLDWTLYKTQRGIFLIGLLMYLFVNSLQLVTNLTAVNKEIYDFMNAEYLPPYFPFVVSTLGFGFMIISFFMYISKYFYENQFANDLAKTGQMTLTHYISHLTLGIILFSFVTGKEYATKSYPPEVLSPLMIITLSIFYFILSFYFSKIWTKKFKNGPFEMLMRKVSN